MKAAHKTIKSKTAKYFLNQLCLVRGRGKVIGANKKAFIFTSTKRKRVMNAASIAAWMRSGFLGCW